MNQPFSVDWRYVPSAALGGDAFGYGFIDPDHFALYLLDVCGHPPSGRDWVHEIKHGWRLMARRDPGGIRLLTRNGYDWSRRYRAMVEAVRRWARWCAATRLRGVNLVFAAPFLSCSRSLCFRCQRFAIASCLFSTTHGNAAM
jgi:hypothetical protein